MSNQILARLNYQTGPFALLGSSTGEITPRSVIRSMDRQKEEELRRAEMRNSQIMENKRLAMQKQLQDRRIAAANAAAKRARANADKLLLAKAAATDAYINAAKEGATPGKTVVDPEAARNSLLASPEILKTITPADKNEQAPLFPVIEKGTLIGIDGQTPINEDDYKSSNSTFRKMTRNNDNVLLEDKPGMWDSIKTYGSDLATNIAEEIKKKNEKMLLKQKAETGTIHLTEPQLQEAFKAIDEKYDSQDPILQQKKAFNKNKEYTTDTIGRNIANYKKREKQSFDDSYKAIMDAGADDIYNKDAGLLKEIEAKSATPEKMKEKLIAAYTTAKDPRVKLLIAQQIQNIDNASVSTAKDNKKAVQELNKIEFRERMKQKYKSNDATYKADPEGILSMVNNLTDKKGIDILDHGTDWAYDNGIASQERINQYVEYAKAKGVSDAAIKALLPSLINNNSFFEDSLAMSPEDFVRRAKRFNQADILKSK